MELPIVLVKAFHHRNEENIGIFFDNNIVLNNAIRKIKGIKWSQTNKCWYLPLNESSYKTIQKQVDGLATIDTTHLKPYLQKRKLVEKTVVKQQMTATQKAGIAESTAWKLSKENLLALEQFIQQLK